MFGSIILSLIIAGIAFGIRAIYLKASNKQGRKSTRVIIWTAAGALVALQAIAAMVSLYNDRTDAIQYTAEVSAPAEPVAEPVTEPSADEDGLTTAQINEIAAEMAWNDQTPSDQAAMCTSWSMDPSVAIGIWESQELDADLIREMGKMLDRNCNTI